MLPGFAVVERLTKTQGEVEASFEIGILEPAAGMMTSVAGEDHKRAGNSVEGFAIFDVKCSDVIHQAIKFPVGGGEPQLLGH
jgi:hypothetical protein